MSCTTRKTNINILKAVRPAARAIIISEDEILLLKDLSLNKPDYGAPGGGIEFGERARDALKREMQEEIGVDLPIDRFLGCFEQSFYHERLGQLHDLSLYFLVTLKPEQKSLITSHEERYECCWVKFEQLSNLNVVSPQLPALVQEWVKIDLEPA